MCPCWREHLCSGGRPGSRWPPSKSNNLPMVKVPGGIGTELKSMLVPGLRERSGTRSRVEGALPVRQQELRRTNVWASRHEYRLAGVYWLAGELLPQASQAGYGHVTPCAGNEWFPGTRPAWPARTLTIEGICSLGLSGDRRKMSLPKQTFDADQGHACCLPAQDVTSRSAGWRPG